MSFMIGKHENHRDSSFLKSAEFYNFCVCFSVKLNTIFHIHSYVTFSSTKVKKKTFLSTNFKFRNYTV